MPRHRGRTRRLRGWLPLALLAAAVPVGPAAAGVGGTGAGAAPLPATPPTMRLTAVSSGGTAVYRGTATFSGPVTVGHLIAPLSGLPLDLAQHGYVQQEFFASGTARSFRATSQPSNGRWTVVPTTSAPYKTRIIVRRPSNPAHFNGTVVVEWMNESAGESAPDWDYLNPALMRAGDAYVAVSAQALGIEGGAPLLGSIQGSGTGLVQQEPARYGSLHHPGDQYALDIFNQIGLGLHTTGSHVLGPLRPRHVVAVGESQSAFYLTTFANAIQPLGHAFDGIFIHSRGGGGAALGESSIASAVGAGGLRIRTDLRVPVFMFETQTDVIELGYVSARQPNTPHIRTWEVAGTSHADSYLVGGNDISSLLGCTAPVNTGPQHEVVQAAFARFRSWVVHGAQPPSPHPFRLSSRQPPTLALDAHGNVIGGVRTPAVDVPVATLSGAAPPGSSAVCALFGSTVPFGPQTLASLYGSRAKYLAQYRADLSRAIAAGYLLAADRGELLAKAAQVQIPAA